MHSKMAVLLPAAALLVAAAAMAAPLAPNDSLYDPTVVPPGGTAFDTVLPAYFTPANLVTSETHPMTIDFSGSVESRVYRNNPFGGYTFAYVFRVSSEVDLVRTSFAGPPWQGVNILGAGADGSGSSGTGDPNVEWTDGDPNFIGRDPGLEYPYIQWRVNNIGTVIGAGDVSAVIWLETDVVGIQRSEVGLLDSADVGKATVLVVPEPTTVLLVMAGLGGLARLRRRSA